MESTVIGIIEDDATLLDNYANFFGMHKDYLLSFKFPQIADLVQYEQTNEVLIPDIILLDIHLPLINGIDGIHIIHRIFPNAKIVMLSGYEDENYIIQAIKNGAIGYLVKTMSLFAIEEKISNLKKMESPMATIATNKILQYLRETDISNAPIPNENNLTKREYDIVNAIKEGLSYKSIGVKLGISAHTVNQHLKKVYLKMNVNTKGELMAKMLKHS